MQDRAEAEALIRTMSHAVHLGFCEEVWKGLRRALTYVLVISRQRLHVSARTLHLVQAPEATCYCITVILPPGAGHGVLVLLLCVNPSIRPFTTTQAKAHVQFCTMLRFSSPFSCECLEVHSNRWQEWVGTSQQFPLSMAYLIRSIVTYMFASWFDRRRDWQ